MFNEEIHAFPLLDIYEELKKYKKADSGHQTRWDWNGYLSIQV